MSKTEAVKKWDRRRSCGRRRIVFLRLAACLGLLLWMAPRLKAAAPADGPSSGEPDYSANTHWFPNLLKPYLETTIPEPVLTNTKTLEQMIREGRIELSAAQFVDAVIENNLDLAIDRYDTSFAQADLLRAKGGQAARGVDAAGASVPTELFSAAIGSGVGNITTLGGIGVTGSYSGQQRSLNLQPKGAYDPTFLFNFSWDRTTSPLNTVVLAGIPAVTPTTAYYQFGWEQAFTTGTSFSVQMSNQRQDTTQEGLIYNPTVISRMSINLIQQITNGFGFAVNRRFQTVARNNIKIANDWFRQQAETVVAQSLDSYWELASAQEQVSAAQQALRVAQQLYEDNKKRLEIGVVDQLDVTSAESEVAATNRDLIVAQTNLQEEQAALKNFFSKQITDTLGSAVVVATDPLPEPKDADIPPLQEALATAMQNRPELPQAEGAVKNGEVAVQVTRNFLKPTVNLFGLFATAGLSGDELMLSPLGVPVLVSSGLARELTEFVHFKYPEYSFGFALTIPLRNRSAQGDSARAQLDERQAETVLKRTTNQVELEVRNGIIGLTQAKAEVASARQAVLFNQENVEGEEKKLALGASTSYNVILVRRDLFAAQLAEVQARAIYAQARVEMDRSMGVLLEKNHVSFEDALRGLLSSEGGRQ